MAGDHRRNEESRNNIVGRGNDSTDDFIYDVVQRSSHR